VMFSNSCNPRQDIGGRAISAQGVKVLSINCYAMLYSISKRRPLPSRIASAKEGRSNANAV